MRDYPESNHDRDPAGPLPLALCHDGDDFDAEVWIGGPDGTTATLEWFQFLGREINPRDLPILMRQAVIEAVIEREWV